MKRAEDMQSDAVSSCRSCFVCMLCCQGHNNRCLDMVNVALMVGTLVISRPLEPLQENDVIVLS
jgi:hypothetical protein